MIGELPLPVSPCAPGLEGHELRAGATAALPPQHVHVWYHATDALRSEAAAAAVGLLSPAERARHDRLRFAADRRDYACAHALLRTTLSRYSKEPPAAWTFSESDRGKPALASSHSSPLSFSLSHTRGFVACAVASGADVGLDVESLNPETPCTAIAERCFAPSEIVDLARCADDDRARRFLELWTLKEAFVKATGAALSRWLAAAAFDLSNTGRIVFNPPPGVDARHWQFASFAPTPRHRAAVALRRSGSQGWQVCAMNAAEPEETVSLLRTSVALTDP